MLLKRLFAICFFVLVTNLAFAGGTVVDDESLANEKDGKNWLAFGRTYSEQRFSPLTQISAENVNDLGLAWHLDLPNDRSLVGTPLVVDGVM